MNEVLNQLLNRRSFRAFKKEKIKTEDLNLIKEAIIRAPTGGNMCLYSVIIVDDQNKKDKLSILCDNQPMIKTAPLVMVFLADNQKWVDYFKYSNSEHTCNKPNRKLGFGDLHLSLQDAIIAAQSGVVAADSLSIGSVYIGDIIENYEEVQSLLNLPPYAVPACMVIFGYKKENHSKHLIERCETDSIFMRDVYEKKTFEQLEKAYKGVYNLLDRHKSLPFEGANVADYYYNKKFISDFMNEMNRSTEVFFEKWKK